MAWSITKVDTAANLITAVNALTATTATNQEPQLSRVKSLLVAEINALGTGKMRLDAAGTYDGDVSTMHVTVQLVVTNANGEIVSTPNPPKNNKRA